MKLRYTGTNPVSFADFRIGELHPGQEFVVADESADGYLSRADVEQVTEPEPKPASKPARAKKEPEAPEVTENVG